jgi:glycosyltransferase involved in cell wall biosynthesis
LAINTPLVSIVIDNYNYGRFLKEAIDSALNQTYQNKEIIVVDDGSTDNSPEIILEYGNKIIPIFKKNGGQASAFNAGFRESSGDIVIFLDSDDVLLSTAIEKAVEGFDSSTVSKVHWQLWNIDGDGKRTGEILPVDKLIEGKLIEELIKSGPTECGGPPNSPPCSGNAWSRAFLQEILPIPEKEFKQTADFYLMVLAPVHGEIKKVDEPLGLYRVHGKNSTLSVNYTKNYLERFEYCCDALSEYLNRKGINISPSIWPRNHWFHQIHYSLKEIETIVAPTDSFILVDENHWGIGESVAERKRIHFLEKEGQYWGLPADDKHAIAEIEVQRKNGVAVIAFAWSSFWVLDYFKGMHNYLKSNYKCILENERLMVFNLYKENHHNEFISSNLKHTSS